MNEAQSPGDEKIVRHPLGKEWHEAVNEAAIRQPGAGGRWRSDQDLLGITGKKLPRWSSCREVGEAFAEIRSGIK